jgi:hypothetical protein
MADPKRSFVRRRADGLGRLSPVVVLLLGLVVALGASGSGYHAHPAYEDGLRDDDVDEVQTMPDFTHADHETVDCARCHTSTVGHGVVSVTTIQDCRSCHHNPPVSTSCARCHAAPDGPTDAYRTVRSVSFSVGTQDPRRVMTFPHGEHNRIDCARCHTQGLSLAPPASLDCASCHRDHHTAESDCASCHRVAPVQAHPPSQAHVTCSGAACHQQVPFETVPRTRAFCLGCHQNMRQHEAPRPCAECHTLPAPLPQTPGRQ